MGSFKIKYTKERGFHKAPLFYPVNKHKGDSINMKRDIQYSVGAYDSGDLGFAEVLTFLNTLSDDDVYVAQHRFSINESLIGIINTIKSSVATETGVKVKFHFIDEKNAHINFWVKGIRVILIRLVDDLDSNDPLEVAQRDVSVAVVGVNDAAVPVFKYIKEKLPHTPMSKVSWHFMGDGHRSKKSITITQKHPVYSEYYPYLNCDIDTYLKAYLDSDSSILLMLGDPGTGKTSLLRDFILKNKLSTVITYDELIIGSDGFFVDFLTNDKEDLLIVEDADLILTDRENDGNKIMSKLLNVSDGMIKINERKKIVFTANITDIDTVDAALIRPGRAFDTLRFRPLTFSEALVAAAKAGVEAPTVDKDYSLAELFNRDKDVAVRNMEQSGRVKFGFGR